MESLLIWITAVATLVALLIVLLSPFYGYYEYWKERNRDSFILALLLFGVVHFPIIVGTILWAIFG